MAYNASDETQVKKARKTAEVTEAHMLNEVRRIMGSTPGRRWIYKFLEMSHVFGMSIIFGQPDRSAFNEGERNIGNMLLADVQNAAPELYLKMIAEAKSQKISGE